MRHFSSNLSPLDVINKLDSEEANFRKNKKQPSKENIEQVVGVGAQRKLAGTGSIVSSWGSYHSGDDTTTFDTQKLRDSFLRNPITYRYCTDLPREALYDTWSIVARPNQESDNEGLRAILYWKTLFEADPKQSNLNDLLIFADQYFRHYGEIALELRFARSPMLNLMGFDGEMLKYVDTISPMLLPQSDGVQYGDDGKIKAFRIYDKNGMPVDITKPDEVRRIVYFHNQPPNEHRGVSRLRPLMSLMDGHDDLRELNIMMMEHLAMPVEWYSVNEEGLSGPQIGKIKTDLQSEILATLTERRRAMIVNERVKLSMIGAEGKNLDIHVFSDRLKADIYQGVGIPLPYIEAEGSTKSTVEVQHQHYLKSQLMAQDQSFARKLLEQYIFPLVLREMDIDVRLTPTLYFPEPYVSHDVVAQAMADSIYTDIIGVPAVMRVIEREGFNVPDDYVPPTPQKKTDPATERSALYEYINGHGSKHQVIDEIIQEESGLIARGN